MIKYRTYTNDELCREFHENPDPLIRLLCERLAALTDELQDLEERRKAGWRPATGLQRLPNDARR